MTFQLLEKPTHGSVAWLRQDGRTMRGVVFLVPQISLS